MLMMLCSSFSDSNTRGVTLSGSLLPTFVWLLVRVPSRCGWHGLCASNEVLSPLIRGDVDVRLPEQLFRGGGCFLKYGSDKSQIVGSPIEVFNHYRLNDLGDTVPHCLKPFGEQMKSFIIRRLMDLRSHGCAGLSERDWKFAINQ
jgi:hypothetical protein